jgi:hypothetical protein
MRRKPGGRLRRRAMCKRAGAIIDAEVLFIRPCYSMRYPGFGRGMTQQMGRKQWNRAGGISARHAGRAKRSAGRAPVVSRYKEGGREGGRDCLEMGIRSTEGGGQIW